MDRQSTLTQLRAALVERADPAHARFHQAYHKSTQRFYGLRTPQLRAVWREVWPGRAPLPRAAVLPLLDPLWAGGSFEEAATALHLLGRAAGQLTAADLPLLHAQTRRCAGWGLLDALAIGCLGPLALARGAEIHAPVMRWLDDEWLWTRRAALLIHVVPARRGALAGEFAWPSFAARLHEREFFIRKASGWALRECAKRYAPEVAAFARARKGEMSGLTFREATRNLPAELRAGL